MTPLGVTTPIVSPPNELGHLPKENWSWTTTPSHQQPFRGDAMLSVRNTRAILTSIALTSYRPSYLWTRRLERISYPSIRLSEGWVLGSIPLFPKLPTLPAPWSYLNCAIIAAFLECTCNAMCLHHIAFPHVLGKR